MGETAKIVPSERERGSPIFFYYYERLESNFYQVKNVTLSKCWEILGCKKDLYKHRDSQWNFWRFMEREALKNPFLHKTFLFPEKIA